MGNVSPRSSKSYHDGLNNHLSLSTITTTTTTPNRSSWKRQLQIINDTLNIKKFSLRHTHRRSKRYRITFDENNNRQLSTSMTTQNFHDLIKNNCEKSTKDEQISKKLPQENRERQNSFKKSFSLFSIKQPLADSTNKEFITKSINNTTNTIKEKDEEQQQQQPSSNSIIKNSTNIISHKPQESLSLTQENHPTNVLVQHRRRHKFEITTGTKL
jgi:hypothetical protein